MPNIESLASLAYDRIESMIVTLQMKPGQVFTERELVDQLEIGRTPIREALQILKHQGLIKIMPRRGMIVTDVNITDFFLMLETRTSLEELLIRNACKRAKPEHKERLQKTALEMEIAAKQGEALEFMRLDHEFDTILSEAARNPFAAEMLEPLHAHCRRLWFYSGEESDLAETAQYHIEIMKGISNGDSEGALAGLHKLVTYLNQLARSTIEI